MSPRISYYSIISVGKKDYYQILIDDENIESIVIVLNTASGETELEVNEIIQNDMGEYDFKTIRFNKDYLPDVIK